MSSFLYLILPALGGYTLTSLYLLKNPLLLHKRKRLAFHSRHISHRGGECGPVPRGVGVLALVSGRDPAETGGVAGGEDLQFPLQLLEECSDRTRIRLGVAAGVSLVCFFPSLSSPVSVSLLLCSQDVASG